MARKIYILVGYKCNEACKFCGLGEEKEIQWPLYKEVLYRREDIMRHVDYIVEKRNFGSGDLIEFSGGEPTIHPDMISILSYSRERFSGNIYLFSNGLRFADHRYAESYAAQGVNLTISTLHGPDEETHDGISMLHGSFKRTVKGFHHLLELGAPLSIKFIVNKENYKTLPKWAEFVAKNFPLATFMINGLAIWGQSKINAEELIVKFSDTVPYVEKAADILIDNNLGFGLYFMPTCLFDASYWQYFGIRYYDESVLEASETGRVDTSDSFKSCYNMPAACVSCALMPRCVWAWKPYTKRYGDEELRPVLIHRGQNGARLAYV